LKKSQRSTQTKGIRGPWAKKNPQAQEKQQVEGSLHVQEEPIDREGVPTDEANEDIYLLKVEC